MKLYARICILSLFTGFALTACGGAKPPNNAPAANAVDPNAPKTSAEELDLLITFPFEAEDCIWKASPDKKEITAVLHFDTVDTGKLAAEVERIRPGEEVIVSAQSWYPSDLVVESDVHGADQLRGKAFAADPFFKEPFTSGRLIRIEGTDYWILELRSK